MTRIIKASEVKPGMTIQWFDLGIKSTCVVSSIEPSGNRMFQEIMASGGGEATLDNYAPVTVLSEPASAQPEEPTAFGARVTVGGLIALRTEYIADEHDPESAPWRVLGGRYTWRDTTWEGVCRRGQVTVIPDQGWAVPADTPEVPERIEEWPENDTALRTELWIDAYGDRVAWNPTWEEWECRHRVTDVHMYAARYPQRGPWTRDSDA